MSNILLEAWLRLHHCPNLGCRSIEQILEHYQTPENFLADLDHAPIKPLIAKTLKQQKHTAIEADLKWLNANPNHHIIHCQDPLYPKPLLAISAKPPLLFVKGNVNALSDPQCAIVGTRKPTPLGQKHAIHFASGLVEVGLTITSGLAFGIDAASHRGALAKSGRTIAVLGNGLASIYPKSHTTLAQQILEHQGTWVSEFSPSVQPLAHHFPRRNRIISGLSLGVLVVEAAHRSGSLITARFALEQGREVLTIPGSLANPQARGCHQLLKAGATLVESVAEIATELHYPVENIPAPNLTVKPAKHSLHHLICQLTLDSPMSLDDLCAHCHCDARIIRKALLQLEQQQKIQQVPGGYLYCG